MIGGHAIGRRIAFDIINTYTCSTIHRPFNEDPNLIQFMNLYLRIKGMSGWRVGSLNMPLAKGKKGRGRIR